MAKNTDPTSEQIEQFEKLQIEKRDLERKEEIRYVTYLNKLYAEASIYKQQLTMSWDSYVQFVRGNHWPTRRPSHKVSAVCNFIIENIERKTALLTDAKPIPKVVPRSDTFQNTADVLNDLIASAFESNDFIMATADLISNAQIFGSGFMGTVYDRSLNNGRGGIGVPSVDPRCTYFDPLIYKSYLLCDAEYVIIEDVWPVSKAQDIYPKVADRIRPDAGLSPFRATQNTGFFASLYRRVFQSRPINDSPVDSIPRVYIREFWLRDRKKTNGKYDFKNAARKSVLIGDSVLADDGDNPYDDGLHPYDMLVWHVDTNTGWGWGDVELLKSPQEQFNKLIALILENATLMSNAIWVGDADALTKEEWEKLNNAPGTHVKKRPGRELRREPGVPLPEYVFNAANFLKIFKDEATGMVDVMKGIRTGQVSSGVGIESLQLAAQALVRLRSRSVETMQTRIGRKMVSRIFQFYEPERIFEALKARTSRTDEQIKAIESELLKPTTKRREGAWMDVVFSVEPGSSLQLAKQAQQGISMQLRKMQVIDDSALLESLEYPHRDDIVKRVEKKRQDDANKEVEAQRPAGTAGANTQFPNQIGGSPAGEV